MDELDVGPRLEKRLMPLLDVALSLVGVLILMVTVSNEARDSGIDGQTARIDVRESGEVQFGDRILGTSDEGLDDAEVALFLEELEQLESPLVIIHYTRPSNDGQSVGLDVVRDLNRIVAGNGTNIKVIGHTPNSEETK